MAMTERGQEVTSAGRRAAVERLLSSRDLVGPRCWGMAMLYYRAGLTQEDIGTIFGLTRQAVSSQLARALRLVESVTSSNVAAPRTTAPRRPPQR